MKKIIPFLLILMMFTMVSMGVLAASNKYSGTVKVYSDLEDGPQKKTSSNMNATNKVDYIQRGKLYSWIENSENGLNITSQAEYTKTGTYNMKYYSDTHKGKSTKLNISTSIATYESVKTNGYWDPK